MGKASRKKQEQRSVAELKAQHKSASWLWVAIGAVVVLGVGLVVLVSVRGTQGTSNASASVADSTWPTGTDHYDNLTRNHVDGKVAYPLPVPVGGDHNPVWQNCGFYSQPVQDENAVHSLEHGAVWITYAPGANGEDVQRLKALAALDPYVLVTPDSAVPAGQVWATAWGYQLKASGSNDSRLADFVKVGARGKQTPEPGAACSGGIGTPQT